MKSWPGPRDERAYIPPSLPRPLRTRDEIVAGVVEMRTDSGLPVDDESIRRAMEEYDRWGKGWHTAEEKRESSRRRGAGPDPTSDDDPRRQESEALSDRIWNDREELVVLGIDVEAMDTDFDHVEIYYFAGDRGSTADILRARYGPRGKPHWVARKRLGEQPHEFGSWVSDGTELTVFYGLPLNDEKPGRCTVEELEDRVIVSLTIRAPQGHTTLAGGFAPSHATLTLQRPLGDRIVIDAATMATRPRWTPRTRSASTSK